MDNGKLITVDSEEDHAELSDILCRAQKLVNNYERRKTNIKIRILENESR